LWQRYENKLNELVEQTVTQLFHDAKVPNNPAVRDNLITRKLELNKEQWADGTILDTYDSAQSFEVHVQKFVESAVTDEQLALEYRAANRRHDTNAAKRAKDKLCARYYTETVERINKLAVKLTKGNPSLSQRVAERALDTITEKWADGTIIKTFDPAGYFKVFYIVIIKREVLTALQRVFGVPVPLPLAVIAGGPIAALQQVQAENIAALTTSGSLLPIKPYKSALIKLREGIFELITARDRAALAKWANHAKATPIEILGRLQWLEPITRIKASRRANDVLNNIIKAQERVLRYEAKLIALEEQALSATGDDLRQIQQRIEQTKVQLQNARMIFNQRVRKLRRLKLGLNHVEIVWVLLGETDKSTMRRMKRRADQVLCRLDRFPLISAEIIPLIRLSFRP